MLISLLLSTALAQAPEFTVLSEGQPATFEGALLSPPAIAEILARPEELQLQCDLDLEFQLDKAATEFQLERNLLDIRIETLTKSHKTQIEQKDLEIKSYQKTIKKQSPQYKWLWFTGGVALGGITYYGIQKAIIDNVANP